jgi:hypothetical protein
MGDEQPGSKDTLGKDIEDGVGNDLSVNTNLARAIGKTPDTVCLLVNTFQKGDWV